MDNNPLTLQASKVRAQTLSVRGQLIVPAWRATCILCPAVIVTLSCVGGCNSAVVSQLSWLTLSGSAILLWSPSFSSTESYFFEGLF